MSKRFWIYAPLALLVILVGWEYSRAHMQAPVLRSEHSEPVQSMPQQMVAVVPDGKQFHDPSCRYIHGKPQVMTAEQAVKLGYTPDPRCLRKVLMEKH
jgi:hypothetical protein